MVVTPGGVFPERPVRPHHMVNAYDADCFRIAHRPRRVVAELDHRGQWRPYFPQLDGIRSLLMARRDFWSWGNSPISFEMDRVIAAGRCGGLSYGSGGAVRQPDADDGAPPFRGAGSLQPGLVALNFDPFSQLAGKAALVWDGMWTGSNMLQVIKASSAGCIVLCLHLIRRP